MTILSGLELLEIVLKKLNQSQIDVNLRIPKH